MQVSFANCAYYRDRMRNLVSGLVICISHAVALHVLLASIPYVGHLRPMLELGLELRDHGHQVTLASGYSYETRSLLNEAKDAGIEIISIPSIFDLWATDAEQEQNFFGLLKKCTEYAYHKQEFKVFAHIKEHVLLYGYSDGFHTLYQKASVADVVVCDYATWVCTDAASAARPFHTIVQQPTHAAVHFGDLDIPNAIVSPPPLSGLLQLANTLLGEMFIGRGLLFRDVTRRQVLSARWPELASSSPFEVLLYHPNFILTGLGGADFASHVPSSFSFLGPLVASRRRGHPESSAQQPGKEAGNNAGTGLSAEEEAWLARGNLVYISLGTTGLLHPQLAATFLDIVTALPNYFFLWKLSPGLQAWLFEDAKLKLPRNMELTSWVTNQAALLRDTRLVAFVAHGGYNGPALGLMHGVPMLNIPVLPEQEQAALRLEATGCARSLPLRQGLDQGLAVLTTFFANLSYHREHCTRAGKLLQSGGGVERAVELVELYAATSSEGLVVFPLPLYRRLRLDLNLLLLGLFSAVLCALFCCLRVCFRRYRAWSNRLQQSAKAKTN
eukprot:g45846.t1